jgi:hypothetical protein
VEIEMKNKALKIRQGDVLIQQVRSIPDGERKAHKDGAVAYGEVTGHKHALMSADTGEVFEINGKVFIHVNDRGISLEGDISKLLPEAERIAANEAEAPARRMAANILLCSLPTAGAILIHGTEADIRERPIPSLGEDRHWPVALLPGEHASLIQSEYSPEEIRNVAD